MTKVICSCSCQDPREYFDSQQANALRALGGTEFGTNILVSNLSKEEAYSHLKEQISEVKSQGLKNPIIQSDTALKVLLIYN
jgi:transcription initiation factor TFIIH subunit 1